VHLYLGSSFIPEHQTAGAIAPSQETKINVSSTRNRIKIIIILFFSIALFACLQNDGQHLTSTSETSGNPTGLRILFRKDSHPISLNGTLEIFAATQIPVPGYSPAPLMGVNLEGAESVEIEASAIQSIPDSLWPAKSVEGDSIRNFNVVVSGDSFGLILKGIGLRKGKVGPDFLKSGTILPNIDEHAEVEADLVQLMAYVGKTDTNRFSLFHEYYLFIYGTGFVAKAEQGVFKIAYLPMGQHDAFFLPLPKGERPTGGDRFHQYFQFERRT
jgi:hypothetical protein